MQRAISGLVIVAAVASHTPAQAGQDSERDRQQRAGVLLREGQTKYDLGKFDEAIVLFGQAYEIWPYAEALYNLGQCWRRKKDFEKAIFYLKAYLRNSPDAPNREDVEERIRELETLLAQQDASGGKPPTGVQVPPARTLNGTSVPAGKPVSETDIEPRAAGGTPQDSVPASRAESAPWYSDGWGWATAGAGLIGVGAGTFLFVSAGDLRDEAEGAPSEGQRQRLLTDADQRDNFGTIVTIGGAAVLMVGVGMLLWNPKERAGAHGPSHSVGMAISPGWLGIKGEF